MRYVFLFSAHSIRHHPRSIANAATMSSANLYFSIGYTSSRDVFRRSENPQPHIRRQATGRCCFLNGVGHMTERSPTFSHNARPPGGKHPSITFRRRRRVTLAAYLQPQHPSNTGKGLAASQTTHKTENKGYTPST